MTFIFYAVLSTNVSTAVSPLGTTIFFGEHGSLQCIERIVISVGVFEDIFKSNAAASHRGNCISQVVLW